MDQVLIPLWPEAHLLGKTPHVSPLLRKACQLGYAEPEDVLQLAMAHGCHHYFDTDAIVPLDTAFLPYNHITIFYENDARITG